LKASKRKAPFEALSSPGFESKLLVDFCLKYFLYREHSKLKYGNFLQRPEFPFSNSLPSWQLLAQKAHLFKYSQ